MALIASRLMPLAAALLTVGEAVTLGGFLRHAGAFYTDTANTIRVAGHTLLDASVSVSVARGATVTLRGRNLGLGLGAADVLALVARVARVVRGVRTYAFRRQGWRDAWHVLLGDEERSVVDATPLRSRSVESASGR